MLKCGKVQFQPPTLTLLDLLCHGVLLCSCAGCNVYPWNGATAAAPCIAPPGKLHTLLLYFCSYSLHVTLGGVREWWGTLLLRQRCRRRRLRLRRNALWRHVCGSCSAKLASHNSRHILLLPDHNSEIIFRGIHILRRFVETHVLHLQREARVTPQPSHLTITRS